MALVSTMSFEPVGASATNTRLDRAGTTVLSGGSWLGGAGVDVKSNGPDARDRGLGNNYVTTPQGARVMSGLMWQCVELINRLYLTKGWISSKWYTAASGAASSMYDTTPSNLSKQRNGEITYLNPGDVVVLSGATYGHVAVVNAVNGSSVQTVNQNTQSVIVNATLGGGRLSWPWSGYAVVGVIHRPSTQPPPPPPPPPPPSGYATTVRYALNNRTAPSTSAQVLRVLPVGTQITISCQTYGSPWGSTPYPTNRTWDRLADGTYVHDMGTNTPGGVNVALPDGGYAYYTPGIPRC
ncbi:MAG: CHAP domain-containing protein [Acidobacteria bacterium]|nr:CHAP domain-containing protein [Acidobacteriota bacterium]